MTIWKEPNLWLECVHDEWTLLPLEPAGASSAVAAFGAPAEVRLFLTRLMWGTGGFYMCRKSFIEDLRHLGGWGEVVRRNPVRQVLRSVKDVSALHNAFCVCFSTPDTQFWPRIPENCPLTEFPGLGTSGFLVIHASSRRWMQVFCLNSSCRPITT